MQISQIQKVPSPLATLIVNILVSACLFSWLNVSPPLIVPYLESENEQKRHVIYITNHGWHTGFVLPSEELFTELPQLKERFGYTPYLEIGWGDRGFYQARDITPGLAIKAVFWPTDSVIHMVSVPFSAEIYFPHSEVKRICVDDQGYANLLSFIAQSFERDENGKIKSQIKGIYGDSQFYNAAGHYYMMNTCNKWTAKGLVSAGMEFSPTLLLTAGAVMEVIKESETFLCIN